MKKILTILLIAASAASITACSLPLRPARQDSKPSQESVQSEVLWDEESSKDESSMVEESGKAESSLIEESSKEESSKPSSSKLYGSLEEYVASDQAQEIIDQTQSTVEGVMTIDILAEDGNKLVYQYKYVNQIKNVDSSRASLEKSISSLASVYSSTAKAMEDGVDVSDVIVVVRYVNADDSIIYEQEFDRNGIVGVEESSKDESSKPSSSLTYSSLNEFMDSSIGTQIKNSISQPSDGSKMEIKIEGDDKFVYQYTFSDQINATSEVKDRLEKQLEKGSSTYIGIVDVLERYVDNDNIIVIVRYVNADGSNIYEKEYTN